MSSLDLELNGLKKTNKDDFKEKEKSTLKVIPDLVTGMGKQLSSPFSQFVHPLFLSLHPGPSHQRCEQRHEEEEAEAARI